MLETGHLQSIFQAALQRWTPRFMMRDVRLDGSRLTVAAGSEQHEVDLDSFNRVIVLGAGKASARMAMALEDILGARISGGLVSVKYGHGELLNGSRWWKRATPCPTPRGRIAARRIASSLRAPMSRRWSLTWCRAEARRCCRCPRRA